MSGGSYNIRVSSQKGGVGKTTVAVNLSTALTLLGYRVLLIDMDYTNPSVGFHLGFDQVNKGFMDALNSKASLDSVIIKHAPTGMYVLPSRVAASGKEPTAAKISDMFRQLSRRDYDFIVADTAPGIMIHDPDLLKEYSEAVIITTPEMSACTSAIRLASHFDKLNLKHSLIINRIRNRGYEISMQEIEESYDGQVAASIPEDDIVPLSVAEHIPAYLLNQRSKFSYQIARASRRYAAKRGSSLNVREELGGIGIIARILALFGLHRKKNRIKESLKEE